MKKVTILAFHNSMATTIFGPMDILIQAGRLWNRINGLRPTPFFEVTIASADGLAIKCQNNILVQPHCAIDAIRATDLIVIASATDIKGILKNSAHVVPWIQRHYRRGSHVASICTGVFVLAETGLLDGKCATLHWGFTEMFRRRYPHIELKPDRMIIDQGDLYCSAGTNAGLDLSLYLVEKYCGRPAAVQCAKTMVCDLGRRLQTPYADFLFSKDHGDQGILEVQQWIEQNHTQPMDYDQMARQHGMSRRSLERRFKRTTGFTPLGYQQQLRVETAKRLMEDGSRSWEEIAYAVGYEDFSFLRKLFIRLTGVRPKEYQRRILGHAVKQMN